MNLTYRTIIEPDGDGFHGYVPALKGCHTWGKDLKTVKKNLREAIICYIESLIAHKDDIPQDIGFEMFETFEIKSTPRRHPILVRYA